MDTGLVWKKQYRSLNDLILQKMRCAILSDDSKVFTAENINLFFRDLSGEVTRIESI